MPLYTVMRMPCLMEDEGRYDFKGVFSSKEKAEEAIKGYTSDGYFKPSDFIITVTEKGIDEDAY